MRYVDDVMYHVVKNKDLELEMFVVLRVVHMFDDELDSECHHCNDDDHTDEEVMTTDLMSFLRCSSVEMWMPVRCNPLFNPGHLFRDKSRVERTNTWDHSTNYRLNIHTEGHHLPEDRPDNETSEGETVAEMTATTMSMNSNVATSKERERVRGLMCGHPSVLSAISNSSHVNASTWIFSMEEERHRMRGRRNSGRNQHRTNTIQFRKSG